MSVKKENRIFEQMLHHGNFIVRDHHVHDVRTLPGVTLLDMIYRLAPDCVGSNSIELTRVVFKQPIVTSEYFDKKILVEFTPVDSHWKISVTSYKTKDNCPLDDVCYQNMECLLFPIPDQKPAREINIREFISEADYQVDMDEIYGLAQRVDIKHYSFMKTLGTVYCRKNAELMQLRLGDEAERFREKFYAHPAFLDGSTFASQSIRVRNKTLGADDTPYIPFTIDSFRIYKPLPQTIYTYSENEAYWNGTDGPVPDVQSVDVAIFNEAGELLVEFKKFTMKRIRSAHLIKSLLEETQGETTQQATLNSPRIVPGNAAVVDRTHGRTSETKHGKVSIASYIKEKIAGALQQPAEDLNVSDNFYDLGMDSTQLLWLTKELEKAIGKELYPTLLFEYSSIEKLAAYLNSQFDADSLLSKVEKNSANPVPGDFSASSQGEAVEESDRKLLLFVPLQISQALAAPKVAAAPHRCVVLVAGGRSSSIYSGIESAVRRSANVDSVAVIHPAGEVIAEQIEDTLVQVVAVIKELVSRPVTGDLLVQLIADSSSGKSWATMFSGCFKTLSIEHPRIFSQIILIDDLSTQSSDAIAQLSHSEAVAACKGTAHITYAGNLQQRHASGLQEVDYHASETGFNFRDGGLYVIAGGLGGLGFIMANHLATKVRPKLVLLGRSSLGDGGREKIDQLIKRGAEVLYLQVDLSDLSALDDAFKIIRSKFGPVTGVLHSAGILKDQVIGRKNIEDIRSVVRPKISGLWNLDQVTKEDKIDFFMIFSSLSAVTGNIGQVDYATANSFMDAFAFHRQDLMSCGQRSGDTISINWPLWAEGGMAIDKGVESLMYQSTGLHPLPTAVGLEIIEWTLQHRITQIAVAYGTERKIRKHIDTHKPILPTQEKMFEKLLQPGAATSVIHQESAVNSSSDIAVIGMAGRYPQASNINEFYQNLKEGRNCISGVPKERWDNYDFGYDIDDYYKFGGFIDRIDLFDPLLFGLPPVRAQFLDPQARLFLETTWEACEDAGFYQDREAQNYRAGQKSVGVFVGAFWSHYELFGSENTVRGVPTSLGASLSSISNMTSYCMNFHGPSIAVDTMCSSALTAIHLACESIRRNECQYAIAGGVNLVTHPHKFIFLKENHFLSSEGVCRSFGANGDGYVPGEGVGAVMLTTLDRAISMGYPIRGIIKGSAINHGGKTSGGTVPNPVAQSEVIVDALMAAAVDPRTLSYVEAHGTGTSLGDPIEIQGLTKAFGHWTDEKQYCAIGSSKSNIGHLEAAAGVAGLTKLLLQLEHREIFPSLHAEELNPLIPFQTTPFYVEKKFRTWERPEIEIEQQKKTYPRRALISSFGASGSNASLVVEEYVKPSKQRQASHIKNEKIVGIVLSARDSNRLNEQARRLLTAIRQGALTDNDLPDIAYTLQVGRQPMDERMAVAVKSMRELEQKLQSFINGATAIENLFCNRVKRNNPLGALYSSDNEHKAEVDRWIVAEAYAMLLKFWVEGLVVDWNRLYSDSRPSRIHLPTYPFARDRYWVPKLQVAGIAATPDVGVRITENNPVGAYAAITQIELPSHEHAPVPPKIVLRSTDQLLKYDSGNHNARKISLSLLAGSTTLPVLVSAPVLHEVNSDSVPFERIMSEDETLSLLSIQKSLSNSLANSLFVELSEIDIDAPFTEIGLDSIIGVQWMKAINSEYSMSLKATILYDFPSIRSLSENIVRELRHTKSPSAVASIGEAGLVSVAISQPIETIKQSLISSLATTLFMDAHEVGADMSFVEIGMDSIIAVQWIKVVNAEFPASLKATILYEHSTIQALADHLHKELSNGGATSGALIDQKVAVLIGTIGDGDSRGSSSAQLSGHLHHVATQETSGTAEFAEIQSDESASAVLASISRSLTRSLATILFMDTSEIDEAALFTEYGLDSIIAVQWIKVVNVEYQTSLKATVLYERPSILALAQYLAKELVCAQLPDRLSEVGVAVHEFPSQQGHTEKQKGDAAGKEKSLSSDELAENYRYALSGCRNVSVLLVDVSPDLQLEVFSIGAGDTVVLMPPMGALVTVWMHQIRELSKKYRVLVIHYPGHGRSDFAKGHMTFDRIANDVLKTIDFLDIQEKVHLVGWSMGALISEKIALQNPKKIGSLTLISTPARLEQGEVDATMAVLGNMAEDFTQNIPKTAQGSRESHFEFIRAPFPLEVSMSYLNETLNFDFNSAAKISAETLIIFGARDMVISSKHGLQLSKEIESAKYFKHEEGGHYIPLQNHEWLNEKLIQFFDEVEINADRRNTEMVV